MIESNPPLHQDDLDRARAISRGDERAFRAFYDASFPRLFRFANRHARDPGLAEELTQETLVIALQTMSRYRGESSLMSWLFGIARFRLQRRSLVDARLLRFEDEAALHAVVDSIGEGAQADPSQRLVDAEMASRVHGVLDRLSPIHAECLEGKYVLGLSVRELAQRMGRSEKSVESALSRARAAFREAFLAGSDAEAMS